MPSGAKKRKAAKKKMENKSTSSTSAHSHGDDVKHQVDKQSEDHHSHQKIAAEKDSLIQVERGFKIGREFNEKDGKIEHDLSESSSNSSGSSSSSSSDDESHDVKNSPTIVELAPDVDSVKSNVSLIQTPAENIDGTTIEEAGVSLVETPVVESVPLLGAEVECISNENVEKRPSSVEDKICISGSEMKEGIVIQPDKNSTAVLDPMPCEVQENDDTLTISYGAPRATVDDGAENEKDSGVTQPLLAPDQQAKQTTSWKSCCGLFEMFTGSGR